jgi:hypothetical protein
VGANTPQTNLDSSEESGALMSLRGLTNLILALVALAGTMMAQPDPVTECRKRVSVQNNMPVKGIKAQRRGGLQNGNILIWWDGKLVNGQALSGFCEANPLTGRIVRLGNNQGDWQGAGRKYRITPDDAELVCQREARARFSPGNGAIGARFQPNISTKSTLWVEWEYNSLARTIRKGRCEIDSWSGNIRKFEANNGW